MKKIKTAMIWILGALSAFFYALIKVKEKKIEEQRDEIKAALAREREQEFIAQEEKKARITTDRLSGAIESDLDELLHKQGALRD